MDRIIDNKTIEKRPRYTVGTEIFKIQRTGRTKGNKGQRFRDVLLIIMEQSKRRGQ
jgi:hypothetical protein